MYCHNDYAGTFSENRWTDRHAVFHSLSVQIKMLLAWMLTEQHCQSDYIQPNTNSVFLPLIHFHTHRHTHTNTDTVCYWPAAGHGRACGPGSALLWRTRWRACSGWAGRWSPPPSLSSPRWWWRSEQTPVQLHKRRERERRLASHIYKRRSSKTTSIIKWSLITRSAQCEHVQIRDNWGRSCDSTKSFGTVGGIGFVNKL